ncbi:penicillin-binding protein [Streptomyces somaliensis]|uniref:penicillin-binding transpeptidase domain-containing protein n=1 Tax=Streptomyces somaliensis TaxID=78355 RepID=UPI0020CF2032|nr:penicillin-binding transpeptidase domain-containing protein [Streptomyces somaliensis]MCP9944109.1 penicillin-binding protein [Streptomyces somaliensis]MCP9962657.1 penicillin-binding protein [Streptomyces somaliensis]MCP9975489.1 penicillin-binding protein [Streptomyces somaliensis]
MRSGVRTAVVGGVFAVVAGGVGYGAYNLWDGLTGGRTTTASADGTVRRTGPVTAEEVGTTAKGFLAAWARGDAAGAARFTDDPVAARSALAGYLTQAHIGGMKATAGTPTGTAVPFTVSAVVSYGGARAPWTYTSRLTVVRGLSTGQPRVDWSSAVMHPELRNGQALRATSSGAPAVRALDRNGAELTAERYPSLRPVLDELRQRYGAEAGGTSGVELVVSGEGDAADRTLLTLREGEPGEVRTTLDAGVQAAAEKAVKRYPESSVVAIKPSTGEVRAVANNRKDGWNAAFLGRQAPGSTMKIVTAALLLEKGLVAADRAAQCPAEAMYQGTTFRNLDGFSIDGGTFRESFARSCNTAFVKLIDDVGDDAALGREARDVFGIGLEWRTGVPSSDGSVPAETGGVAAAQYIGQGTVQMNALNIASVTATAKSGVFRQPVLVPASLDGREIARTPRGLDPSAARQLRDVMRAAARGHGTGAKAMAGVSGDKGAKTGSAEVDDQGRANSWFAGFADDLAAASVVQAAGHGGDAAGPLVASVLNAR